MISVGGATARTQDDHELDCDGVGGATAHAPAGHGLDRYGVVVEGVEGLEGLVRRSGGLGGS